MRIAVFLALAVAAGTPVWSQNEPPQPQQQEEEKKPPEKLQIGSLIGAPRPEGFVVEDVRSAESRAPSPFKQTYKAPFSPFKQPVPLAKYERMIGDQELNVSAVDLLAEKLVERYGATLTGKRLVVHEFSYRLEQVVNKPQGMNYTVIPGGGVGLAAALALSIAGSAAGTAMMQGKGIDLKLHVKIDAELDGKRIEARELPMTLSGGDGPARVTRYVIEKFQHHFDLAVEEAKQVKKDEEKKD